MIQTRVALAVCALALVLGACSPADDPPAASAPSPSPSTTESTPSQAVGPDRPTREPIPADLRRLARAFIAYALGGPETELPTAETVAIGLDGRPLTYVDEMPRALSNRGIWKVCPRDAEGYGALSCPVDLLAPITSARRNKIRIVLTRRADLLCALDGVTSPRGRCVVSRPERDWRTCASDFALVLQADRRGQLIAALLTPTHP